MRRMAARAKLPVRMTVHEFLEWDPGDGARYELVDGVPNAMAPGSNVHGYLQNELGRLIGNHLRQRRSDCDVLANPGVVPHLMSAHNVRVPDPGVTCSPVAAGQATLSRPVLLIEILSPSNQAHTWANVRAYTSIPTVQDILVPDSASVAAEVLCRNPDGSWPEEPEPIRDGVLTLASIGFAVALADLYARTGLAA